MPKKSSKEEFIARAKKIHNDRYDYSKVVYVGTHIKIIIICPIHGEFEQRPSAHLQGCGCCKCGFINMASFNRLTLEEFI